MSDEKRIITPDRIRTAGGKYNVSRDEATSIAVQIGQQVYDHVAEEHKKAMEILQRDMHAHFREIRETTAGAILDLQRRSIWFNVAYDLRRFQNWGEEWYWRARYALGLVPDDGVVGGIEPDYSQDDPENVGAPSEQPSREANEKSHEGSVNRTDEAHAEEGPDRSYEADGEVGIDQAEEGRQVAVVQGDD